MDDIFGPIDNPLQKINPGNNYGDINSQDGGLVGFFSNALQLIAVAAGLATLFNLVMAGFDYINSNGDPQKAENAWKKIYMSLTGLVIIALAFVLITIISQLLFGSSDFILKPKIFGPGDSSFFQLIPPAHAMDLGEISPFGQGYNTKGGDIETSANAFANFASNFLGFLTIIAGLWFLLYFVLGGLSWISAAGDAQKVEKAKKQLTDSAIGLIVVVAAASIVFIVGEVLGLKILEPETIIQNLSPNSQGGSGPATQSINPGTTNQMNASGQ